MLDMNVLCEGRGSMCPHLQDDYHSALQVKGGQQEGCRSQRGHLKREAQESRFGGGALSLGAQRSPQEGHSG